MEKLELLDTSTLYKILTLKRDAIECARNRIEAIDRAFRPRTLRYSNPR